MPGQTHLGWPGGYALDDTRTITNSSGGAGNLAVIYEAAEGNEFLVIGGNLQNNDPANSRTMRAELRNSAAVAILPIANVTAAAGGTPNTWPGAVDDSRDYGGNGPIYVAGTNDLRLLATAVANGESATFALVARCSFQDPTITEVTP